MKIFNLDLRLSLLVPVCFNVLSPKSMFWKKPALYVRLVQHKTQLFGKSCILYLWRNTHITERSSELHFGKSFVHIWIYPLDSQTNYQITLSHHSSFLSSLYSALCPLNNKFSNPNTKKIYNKFPNQLRKKENQSLAN